MFRKTLRRLTILNSMVFLLIFIVFGVMLYGYVARQLFDDVDYEMVNKVKHFRSSNGRLGGGEFFEPRILILLRDGEGNIMNRYPFLIQEVDGIGGFLKNTVIHQWQTWKIQGHTYRILSLPYEESGKPEKGNVDKSSSIQEILAVSNVDSEVGILRRLMFIILTGQMVGMMVIIPAGYYLAQRALVPIGGAWEKQQQFVADASHELRTPLAVIKSNAELLLRHPTHTVEEETIRIANVLRETIRMSKLVSTLFTLARADANQIELQVAPVALNEVLTHAIEQFEPLAAMKNITLEVVIKDEIQVVADRERLQQLFVILLDNGIKYTLPHGNIKVICDKQSSVVFITVVDTGCGIEAADLPKVFDRFFRGDKVRSRENGGAGLGLSIAHWIVEKHGGKIWVVSEVGRGSRFYITLPLEKNDFFA